MTSLRLLAALAVLSCASCAGGDGGALHGTVTSSLTYGTDNRRDAYEEPDAAFRFLAGSSSVALVSPETLRFLDGDSVEQRSAPLRAWDDYCDDVPFLDQPTAATCSGVLIDDDLVLTAGHCVEQMPSCRGFAYVFHYEYAEPETLERITRAEVFSCLRVAALEVSPPDSAEEVDYAIVQLDRAMPGHSPVSLAKDGARTPGEPMTVIGFPSGLPVKIDDGATVADPRDDTLDAFTLRSDTFGGSSGSGVYDAAHELTGVFARGTADFVDRGGCRAVRTLSERAPSSDESVTYAARAVSALCAAGWPSERLCDRTSRCGDGVCSHDETAANCSEDCEEPECGDALCEATEWNSCPADCGDRRSASLPDAWYCEPSWFADGAMCDCGCGTPDPDCGTPTRAPACDSIGPAGRDPKPPPSSGGCSLSPRLQGTGGECPPSLCSPLALLAFAFAIGARRRLGAQPLQNLSVMREETARERAPGHDAISIYHDENSSLPCSRSVFCTIDARMTSGYIPTHQ